MQRPIRPRSVMEGLTVIIDSEIVVVLARKQDLRRTAQLHVKELPHGLFPRLGAEFVWRWHRAHLASGYGVFLVATRLDEIVGFVFGSVDRRANVAWIIRHHRPELLRAGIRALATRPAVAAHFLRTRCLRYLRRLVSRGALGASSAATGESPEAQSMQSGVLEAVVVAPEERGKSIGTALVENFLAIVAAAGVERVELVTKAGPAGAAGFYECRGWRLVGSHLDRDGDLVLTYRIETALGDR